MGPSGSGKSTIGNCINGLIPHVYSGESGGEIRIKGRSPSETPLFEISQMVGTVLQDTDGQFIGLTVGEDIAFAMENDCVPQDEMRSTVRRIAETVEVSGLLRSSPFALSGGQKQRVSMAGVMVDDVDILLFDEPLANLDPATGKKAIELIDEIQHDTGKTVVIIEHRLEDALYRDADRIILIAGGCVAADMTPDELLCTDILEKEGVREPLYVTALKCAGVKLRPADRPGRISAMKLDSFAETVKSWYREQPVPDKEKTGKAVLSVQNVSFGYDPSKPVLEDVSFDIHQGEMMAIVGKNGAGKTTLSSLICGFISPDKGRILLNGEDISPLSVKERGESIGLIMQNPNQMISKPMISEEVSLGLRTRGVPDEEIQTRVSDILRVCGLYPYRNWPVSALSFGQKKRVTIASILVMKPDIIILDEPTAGQDYRHYTEFMEFIRDINRQSGTTVIMITHDMHLMLEYTTRAVVISDGHLLADDTPAAVLTGEELADRAYLKRTSLYDLAVGCGIDDADGFTECFIRYERTHRNGTKASDL